MTSTRYDHFVVLEKASGDRPLQCSSRVSDQIRAHIDNYVSHVVWTYKVGDDYFSAMEVIFKRNETVCFRQNIDDRLQKAIAKEGAFDIGGGPHSTTDTNKAMYVIIDPRQYFFRDQRGTNRAYPLTGAFVLTLDGGKFKFKEMEFPMTQALYGLKKDIPGKVDLGSCIGDFELEAVVNPPNWFQQPQDSRIVAPGSDISDFLTLKVSWNLPLPQKDATNPKDLIIRGMNVQLQELVSCIDDETACFDEPTRCLRKLTLHDAKFAGLNIAKEDYRYLERACVSEGDIDELPKDKIISHLIYEQASADCYIPSELAKDALEKASTRDDVQYVSHQTMAFQGKNGITAVNTIDIRMPLDSSSSSLNWLSASLLPQGSNLIAGMVRPVSEFQSTRSVESGCLRGGLFLRADDRIIPFKFPFGDPLSRPVWHYSEDKCKVYLAVQKWYPEYPVTLTVSPKKHERFAFDEGACVFMPGMKIADGVRLQLTLPYSKEKAEAMRIETGSVKFYTRRYTISVTQFEKKNDMESNKVSYSRTTVVDKVRDMKSHEWDSFIQDSTTGLHACEVDVGNYSFPDLPPTVLSDQFLRVYALSFVVGLVAFGLELQMTVRVPIVVAHKSSSKHGTGQSIKSSSFSEKVKSKLLKMSKKQ
ncbi:hypothetical protein CXQ85_001489 [Candidozyma haemuli]|uniref:Uncharacterized protein n=1 Tax=Candidozyma haemuli TaxID=45357 RepID=A0A2V1AMV7_9ASCO|nr:hypothetical protein CXQ85_001489 [[Candida] haemuloni]PVH19188.1 hypothetical protein CXQ85_001489 [[Candida] haemuloni]